MDSAFVQFVTTVAAAALGAFAAAAVGYRYALAKFRRERTFDKQLAWYEKAAAILIETGNKLNWALAADVAKVGEIERNRAWAEAQSALVSLRGLQAEAEMYASPSSYEALSQAIEDVTTLARTIWRISDVPSEANVPAPESDRLYQVAHNMLYHAASRLGTDVRELLQLDPLPREWRLYDREFRELQIELDELRKAGMNFRHGADVPRSIASRPDIVTETSSA